MLQTIIAAIKNRELIAFTYSGIARVVQPAAVGISRAGKNVLRCYQTQGGHVTAGHDWELCEIALMTNLRTTGQTFADSPPGYKRGDKGLTTIYAEL